MQSPSSQSLTIFVSRPALEREWVRKRVKEGRGETGSGVAADWLTGWPACVAEYKQRVCGADAQLQVLHRTCPEQSRIESRKQS